MNNIHNDDTSAKENTTGGTIEESELVETTSNASSPKSLKSQSLRRLHPKVKRATAMTSLITNGILGAIAAAYLVVAFNRDWTLWPGWAALGLCILSFIWFGCALPALQYRYFSFRVAEDELEIHSGWLWITDTIVPMTRVQQVELESGPLLRKYGLAKVSIVTAAATLEIAGLEREEAEQLKRNIGHLAKVEDRDE
ncbi:PH domain-containing protein [Paenibacillus sp. MER 99-2]|uniref:PH domain-containing protein n=1 Tax=Paenibacillus sp. MER 99-2 TaxID=2939572 RepID=UPI002041320A|nr:PH domain-containing protein [Paenibacillus sp. MER 99-2]MCM3174709.1 PH domain-containing protein [Paenibacillus sp. MER 99-2]